MKYGTSASFSFGSGHRGMGERWVTSGRRPEQSWVRQRIPAAHRSIIKLRSYSALVHVYVCIRGAFSCWKTPGTLSILSSSLLVKPTNLVFGSCYRAGPERSFVLTSTCALPTVGLLDATVFSRVIYCCHEHPADALGYGACRRLHGLGFFFKWRWIRQ